MSLENIHKVHCPSCKAENEVNIWDSINVTLDPEIKPELLNGKIFKYNCIKCNFEFKLEYPFLYHDMDKKIMIWYSKEQGIMPKIEKLIDGSYPGRLRRVYEKSRLIEKINIIDDCLDDMIIERLKRSITYNEKIDVNSLYYMCIQEDNMIFMNVEGNQFTVPKYVYNVISEVSDITEPEGEFLDVSAENIFNYVS